VTWFFYAGLFRLYKHYHLRFVKTPTPAPRVSFSGYHGCMCSNDDFYITSQSLTVMETTNDMFNNSLYAYISTETVPYWIRVQVSNRLGDSGETWTSTMARHNSGTYTNQWIVVDNKRFVPGQPLANGTLWIGEELPGYFVSEDVTSVLASQTYWPSYNIPFSQFVYNISGYPAFEQKYGDQFSYTACPRANIFRRDHAKAVNVTGFQRLMRYNDYQSDPLSLGDPCNAVSARCDLSTQNPMPFGGIDCKVTTSEMAPLLQSWAVDGPTHDQQPVFSWNSEWDYCGHYGQPDSFDFEFEFMAPVST